MKKTLISSIITFLITTTLIASTGIKSYATTDQGKRIELHEDGTYSFCNPDENYYGTYKISESTIDNYIKALLSKNGIKPTDTDYQFSFNLIKSLFSANHSEIEDQLGDFTYTITEDKLIITEDGGKETFSWDYEIIDNILYAKVYNFDEEMALGKFINNGKFLEVTKQGKDTNSKIILQRCTI